MKELINRKKAACLALGCFFVFQLFAQEHYLYHRFGLNMGSFEYLNTMGIEVDTNNFFTVGLVADSFGANWNLQSINFNTESLTIQKRLTSVDSNMISGATSSAFIHSEKLIIGGLISYVGQVAAAIYKYDPISGDTLFCKYFVKDGWTRFKQGKLTHDGNYIFIGRTDEFDPAGDYYVVKTDTLGNILWERRYGTAYYDNGLSITPTPDGGYLLFGSSAGYGEKIYLETDGLLIKIDDNGSEQWRTHWGGLYSDCNWSVDVAPNGDIVAGGCIAEDTSGAYVRKMDQEGNLLWDTIFNADTINGTYPTVFYKIQFTENDLIIAAGGGGIYFNDSNYHYAPYLVIFDLNGTVLSNRGYTSFFNGPTSDAWFEDIRPTKDGGYIAGGQYLPAAGDTGNQDMFVLKLDSAGCEYPGCQPPLGIPTPKQESVDFSAYPNPFGSSIIFTVENEMVEEIIITDIRGVLIDRIVMGENQQQSEWQAQDHAPGVYIAVAHGAGQSKALKIVKY